MKKIARYLIFSATLISCLYIGICVLLFLQQRSFIYHPTPLLADDTVPKIHFQNDNADLVVSTHENTGSQAVLYFGGNAEFASSALPQLTDTFPDAAVYALHYRGYSGSHGEPTEKNIVSDGLALFDLIYKSHKSVTIVGRSLGSGVAIQVASLRPASRLVLVTPFNSILELGQQRFPLFPINLILQDKYESWKYAPKISIPTTVIAAKDDVIIPLSSTQKLVPYFKPGIASLIVINGVGHNDISSHPQYVPALTGILK
jgi:pimeloyl-ACP methyl ester carboxylesterase